MKRRLKVEKKLFKLAKELKSKGHHGYSVPYGDNYYLFDKTDKIVYNVKTGQALKWLKNYEYSHDCFVYLSDGHGNRSKRYYLHEFMEDKI